MLCSELIPFLGLDQDPELGALQQRREQIQIELQVAKDELKIADLAIQEEGLYPTSRFLD